MHHHCKGFPDASASAYKPCPSRSRATQGTSCSKVSCSKRSCILRCTAFRYLYRSCALTAASACHQQNSELPSAIPLLASSMLFCYFFDSIAEQGQLASPVIMGKLHARVLYQINPSLLLAASACHHARATHICAGRNRVKVQNLRSLVSYLASHQIDTERCSRFFSQPFSQGLPHVVQGLQQPVG